MTEITAEKPRRQQQRKREKRDVNGWLVLDKPVGMTSTHAVSVVKRVFQAKRAGHAGTLDPLASGLLPIALGEATKTVPFVMDGRKIYRFTVRWGEERDTDDAEGRVAETSAERPSADAIRALLPRFTGRIEQVPPRFSAVKIEGERAYDLARDGEVVELAPRTIEVHRLELVETPDPDHTVLAAECGKGTYVRALARDLGRLLGCFGHVSALRRTAVGPFTEDIAVSLEALQRSGGPIRADTTLGEASGEQEASGEAQSLPRNKRPSRNKRPPRTGTSPGPGTCRAPAPVAGRGRPGGLAGVAGEPRRRRPARPRPGGIAAWARRPGHGGVGLGLRPRLADSAGRGREGRIAPPAHLQPAPGVINTHVNNYLFADLGHRPAPRQPQFPLASAVVLLYCPGCAG